MASQARGLQLLDKIENHDIEGVEQILSRDTDLKVDRKGDTPIHLAARKGYFDIIEILIKKGCNVNQKNQNGFAALHYAARDGRMDIVNFLLKSGADPNIKNKDGDAPIHELVKYQPMDTIEEMITLGMNINLQNKLGRTPLHIAVANGRFDAVETLLTCGARSDIKDKNGRTPADSCKDPQLVKMMNLHSLTMEAMKKGIIMAQGISVSKKNVKNRINLARVGVVLETISMTTDITASFYCRREKSENSSCSISTEKGDEMVSDVFFIKITNVPRICDVTLTLPIYGLPTEQEELFVRFDSGTTLPVLRVQKTGGEKTCTFDTKLTPDTFSIFALFTRAKTDVKNVGQRGGVITTDADEGMRLEIPPDTFTKEANISLKVFPTENETTETDVAMLTDVYNITSDVSDNQNSMKLRLPMHNCVNLDAADDMLLITADDITDDSDENCLQVIDTKPTVRNMSIEYEIPHFSIHVVVSQMQFKENKKSIFERLVSATERQRTAVFFVVVRHENNKMCPMISVECCLAKQAPKRIEKWVSKGYITQDLEQSGSFLFKPYQEFLVYLDGVKTEDSTGKRKLAFLPRRPSFQPYRIQLETNTESFVEGSVMIHKCFNDDKDVSQDNEVVTALPFFIKLKEETAHSEMDDPASSDLTQATTVASEIPACQTGETNQPSDPPSEATEKKVQQDDERASLDGINDETAAGKLEVPGEFATGKLEVPGEFAAKKLEVSGEFAAKKLEVSGEFATEKLELPGELPTSDGHKEQRALDTIKRTEEGGNCSRPKDSEQMDTSEKKKPKAWILPDYLNE